MSWFVCLCEWLLQLCMFFNIFWLYLVLKDSSRKSTQINIRLDYTKLQYSTTLLLNKRSVQWLSIDLSVHYSTEILCT